MAWYGKKDKDGRQIRIEYRGKYLRASRTGGASARIEKKVGPVNLTANTQHGVRASARAAKGVRVGLQQGRFFLIGRWASGPFAFNLSKSSASISTKTRLGRLNLLKPKYSSAKLFGVHLRGENAYILNLIAIVFGTLTWLTKLAFMVCAWIIWLVMAPFVLLADLLIILLRRRTD